MVAGDNVVAHDGVAADVNTAAIAIVGNPLRLARRVILNEIVAQRHPTFCRWRDIDPAALRRSVQVSVVMDVVPNQINCGIPHTADMDASFHVGAAGAVVQHLVVDRRNIAVTDAHPAVLVGLDRAAAQHPGAAQVNTATVHRPANHTALNQEWIRVHIECPGRRRLLRRGVGLDGTT